MKPVLVEWVDSVEVTGWRLLDDIPPCTTFPVRTMGWLIEESDEAITVAGSLGVDQACGMMRIPVVAIKRIINLDLPD